MKCSLRWSRRRVCIVACVLLVILDIGVAVYCRSTQTDYAGVQKDALPSIPYAMLPASVDSWAVGAEDVDVSSRVEQTKDADAIVKVDILEGRDIGYKAMLSSATIREVYKGGALRRGDSITLVEPFELTKMSPDEMTYIRTEAPEDYEGLLSMCGASDDEGIRVMRPNAEPYVSGVAPVVGSKEYVLFLKRADEHLARENDVAAFTFVATPFSCLSLSEELGHKVVLDERYVSNRDLGNVSMISADSKTVDAYLKIKNELLSYAESLA